MLAMLLGAHIFISHSILNCHNTVFTGFCSWHCVKQACALLVCAGFMVFKLVPYKNAAWAPGAQSSLIKCFLTESD